MTLTAADVAEIMQLVEASTFDELNLEIGGVKLCLRRSSVSGRMTHSETAPLSSPAVSAAVPRDAAPVDAGLKDITSPMLGTFYRAPKPGSEPFVTVGSAVNEDSVIAIIEVMKLMNTVRAGVKGVITEVLPSDETLVEFGQVLMRARVDD